MQERHCLKYFAPAWFAVIMGTGGLANILFVWGNSWSFGKDLGMLLAALADTLYFVVLVPWLLRWARYFEYAKRDLDHPLTGNFFVTMPVATVILGTNLNLIWNSYLGESLTYALIFSCWLVGIFGVLFFTFYSTFRMMRVEEAPRPEMINFSWLMAPIANMAVPLIGNPVIEHTIRLHPAWNVSVLAVNIALFGIGFFLFIFISGIVFVRLVNHPFPPAATIPSFGILVSAVGLSVNGIIDSARHAHTMELLTSPDLANLMAMAIWGFGIWVVGIIALICIYQLRRGGIPFSMGWWAFIFPLAAYTISCQKIAAAFASPLTTGYAAALTLLLSLLWLYVFVNTLLGALSGKLFMGTPIPGKGEKGKQVRALGMDR